MNYYTCRHRKDHVLDRSFRRVHQFLAQPLDLPGSGTKMVGSLTSFDHQAVSSATIGADLAKAVDEWRLSLCEIVYSKKNMHLGSKKPKERDIIRNESKLKMLLTLNIYFREQNSKISADSDLLHKISWDHFAEVFNHDMAKAIELRRCLYGLFDSLKIALREEVRVDLIDEAECYMLSSTDGGGPDLSADVEKSFLFHNAVMNRTVHLNYRKGAYIYQG